MINFRKYNSEAISTKSLVEGAEPSDDLMEVHYIPSPENMSPPSGLESNTMDHIDMLSPLLREQVLAERQKIWNRHITDLASRGIKYVRMGELKK